MKPYILLYLRRIFYLFQSALFSHFLLFCCQTLYLQIIRELFVVYKSRKVKIFVIFFLVNLQIYFFTCVMHDETRLISPLERDKSHHNKSYWNKSHRYLIMIAFRYSYITKDVSFAKRFFTWLVNHVTLTTRVWKTAKLFAYGIFFISLFMKLYLEIFILIVCVNPIKKVSFFKQLEIRSHVFGTIKERLFCTKHP